MLKIWCNAIVEEIVLYGAGIWEGKLTRNKQIKIDMNLKNIPAATVKGL